MDKLCWKLLYFLAETNIIKQIEGKRKYAGKTRDGYLQLQNHLI